MTDETNVISNMAGGIGMKLDVDGANEERAEKVTVWRLRGR